MYLLCYYVTTVHCTVPGVCKEEEDKICHLRVHEPGGHVRDLKQLYIKCCKYCTDFEKESIFLLLYFLQCREYAILFTVLAIFYTYFTVNMLDLLKCKEYTQYAILFTV